MSMLNFSMNFSHFNINISIKKDMTKIKNKPVSSLKQELLITEATANIDAARVKYHYLSCTM